MFDLLQNCSLLVQHIAAGKVGFGVNHEMRDFRQDRKKNLDLVICVPAGEPSDGSRDLMDFAEDWHIELTSTQREVLSRLPAIRKTPVGSVLLALEAKACMTEHSKALPRLYDELNSSHLTVHGSSEGALAAGFVCINGAERYVSPDRNKRPMDGAPTINLHKQPQALEKTIAKVRQLPRRVRETEAGYDALAIVAIDCRNDGSEVKLIDHAPAPTSSDIYYYDRMIDRLAAAYVARFRSI
jgi:hypothetical protein